MLPSEAVGETLLFFASFLFPLLSSTSIYPWLAVIPLQSQLCAHTAFFTFVCVSNLPLPPSCDTWDCNPVQFSSVAQSCLTHCDPMDCSTPGFPVHHQLLEFTHTHVCVGDAIQPSHPLLSLLLLPPVPLSIRVFSNESVLHSRWPKYWSFSFSISLSNEYSGLNSLGWTGWISLLSKGFSRVFSNTTVQKRQFFGAQLSL